MKTSKEVKPILLAVTTVDCRFGLVVTTVTNALREQVFSSSNGSTLATSTRDEDLNVDN